MGETGSHRLACSFTNLCVQSGCVLHGGWEMSTRNTESKETRDAFERGLPHLLYQSQSEEKMWVVDRYNFQECCILTIIQENGGTCTCMSVSWIRPWPVRGGLLTRQLTSCRFVSQGHTHYTGITCQSGLLNPARLPPRTKISCCKYRTFLEARADSICACSNTS